MRVASVDIGTNSVRLLVADAYREGEEPGLQTVRRLMTITRLGQSVDRSGALDAEAVDRTLTVLERYRGLMIGDRAGACEAVATSAVREAANSGEFLDAAGHALGSEIRVISGDEEARLSFTGATYDLGELEPVDRPVLVVDIGGGSTEIIVGMDGEVQEAHSVEIGCVRMSERFLLSDPPLPRELEDMERHAHEVISPLREGILARKPGLLVGLAGTVTTLSGIKQGLDLYEGDMVHHSWLEYREVEELYRRLASLPLRRRKSYMKLEPGRADVIVGGTGVLLTILEELRQRRLLVSEKDILDGLALSAAFDLS